MRALLLAAGIGTRLRPLTDTTPKCLVEINGAPLLGRWLETLNSLGANEIVVNTHYLPAMVNDFIASHPLKEIVRINHEHELLGTAGTLRRHSDFLSQNGGIVIHADNYCLADFSKFLYSHRNRPKHCVMTMMTFNTDDPQSCGIVEIDRMGIVIAFHEKISNPPSSRANGAIYALAPEFFETVDVNNQDYNDISKDLMPLLVGKIFTHHVSEPLIDIGTIEKLNEARARAKAL